MLPLCIDQCPDGWSPDLDGNRRLMPRTWEIVRAWPEILTCGVSRLMPGCHIFSHCDRVQPDTYRYHLCLRVPGLAGLRAGTEQIECQTGLAYVFDHRERHEAANLADAPRDVLLVDFVATPAELAALRTWRSARGGAGAAG